VIGKRLNQRYHIIEELGRGGMATAYLAEDERLSKRRVAVKVPLEGTDERLFVKEAKIMAKLSHPNIVNITDAYQDVQVSFLVMDYMDGVSVNNMLAKRKLAIPEALDILLQIGKGLAHAHERNIVHRDLKPSNVLANGDGVYKLTDFGIARARAQDLSMESSLTQEGALMGTVPYFSPEQARGEKATARSDIYSFGIMLYELLTGQRPFVADEMVAVVMKHILEPVPDPRQLNPEIPDSLHSVIQKATQKGPQDRYGNINELLDELQQIYNQLTVPRDRVPPAETEDASVQNLYQTGMHLLKAKDYIEREPEKGEQLLRQAAKAEYPPAMYEIGKLLLDTNQQEAESWLRQAAEAQLPEAMHDLGRYLLYGEYLERDVKSGEKWLRLAAKAGYAPAFGLLGKCFLIGNPLPKDRELGERLLRQAVQANDPEAMYVLGRLLRTRKVLKRDKVEGEKWLQAASAAGFVATGKEVQYENLLDYLGLVLAGCVVVIHFIAITSFF
jgi:hypothetical protein